MKVNLGLYQLDIFNIPSWVSFGHFHASFRKYQSGMPYTLEKNISKLVFVNSRFQIDYIVYISLKSSEKNATGNFVMFISLHWYCHRGLGCGKMIKFTLKIFNIFGDVYTRDGTISLCQSDAIAQIVMSHKVQFTSSGSIPFTPSLVTKWHDRHRYLSIQHVPYLMGLSSPRHCSKTLIVSDLLPRPELSSFIFIFHLITRIMYSFIYLFYKCFLLPTQT